MEKAILIKSLENFGLTNKEALVYLASLELGSSTVLNIAKLSELKRPTVYLIVEQLSIKGLLAVEMKGFKKTYKAESPDRLEDLLNQKKQELLRNLPVLNEIYLKEKGNSFIRYYEGLNAIKLLYQDLLKEVEPHDYYLVMGNQEEWFSGDKAFFRSFIEKRAKLDLDLRLLLQDSILARDHKKYEKNFNEKIKILPETVSLTTNLVITPKKVIIHLLSGPALAIVIENKNISKMNKGMFELIWSSL